MKQYNEDVASLVEKAKQEYENAVKSAENELEKAKQEIEQARKEAFAKHSESSKETRSQCKMNILMEEVRTTKELLEKLYRARSEMYALNIVFDKYRNLVALSTFYEWIICVVYCIVLILMYSPFSRLQTKSVSLSVGSSVIRLDGSS